MTSPATALRDRELTGRVETVLDRRVDSTGPGAAVGVYRDGRLVASAARGLASLEYGIPLTEQTPVEIASVAKQVTAATILVLAEEGRLDLDADVREHVPELRPGGVTLRHCLRHTSGLPDYLDAAEATGTSWTTACGYTSFLRFVEETTVLDFAPGSEYAYSNTGFVLAATAACRVSGRSFGSIVSERVFIPLHMASSTLHDDFGKVVPQMAFSYSPASEDGFRRVEMSVGEPSPEGIANTVGDGQILTTIADFAGWQGFLLDGRVLGSDIRAQLLERTVLSTGRETTYGMGLWYEQEDGLEVYGHSGSMWGYRAYSLTEPRSGTGVAVFGNRADLDAREVAWQALRSALSP